MKLILIYKLSIASSFTSFMVIIKINKIKRKLYSTIDEWLLPEQFKLFWCVNEASFNENRNAIEANVNIQTFFYFDVSMQLLIGTCLYPCKCAVCREQVLLVPKFSNFPITCFVSGIAPKVRESYVMCSMISNFTKKIGWRRGATLYINPNLLSL